MPFAAVNEEVLSKFTLLFDCSLDSKAASEVALFVSDSEKARPVSPSLLLSSVFPLLCFDLSPFLWPLECFPGSALLLLL